MQRIASPTPLPSGFYPWTSCLLCLLSITVQDQRHKRKKTKLSHVRPHKQRCNTAPEAKLSQYDNKNDTGLLYVVQRGEVLLLAHKLILLFFQVHNKSLRWKKGGGNCLRGSSAWSMKEKEREEWDLYHYVARVRSGLSSRCRGERNI